MRTWIHLSVFALAAACAEPSTVPTGASTNGAGGAVSSSAGQGGQGAATSSASSGGGFGGSGGATSAGGATSSGGGGAGGGLELLTLTALDPNDGLATAGASVTITGTGFTTGMTAAFGSTTAVVCTPSGSTSATCVAPTNAGAVALVDVTLTSGAQVFTLPSSFTYTGVRNETGLAAEADYCNLQYPPTTSVTAGQATELIFGRIFETGVTEAAGGNANIFAEVGVGPSTTDPTTQTGWRFQAAAFNIQSGNDDEYSATLVAPSAGTYAYAFRFSQDAGLTFTYCDLDGAGSNGSFSFASNQLGVLTVN